MFDSSKSKVNIGLLKSKLELDIEDNWGNVGCDGVDGGGGGVDAVKDDPWGSIMRICEGPRLRIALERKNRGDIIDVFGRDPCGLFWF
jgi:hypothetical protein